MSRLSNALLWTALVLALVGTLKHTAWAFATLENGDMLSGYIQAAALDVGLVALAIGIQTRKRTQQRARWLWIGAGCFCSISVYANFLHGYAHQSALSAPLAEWRPALLAAVLPLMLFYLVEIVAHAPQTITTSAPAPQPLAAPATTIPQASTVSIADTTQTEPVSAPATVPIPLTCEHCERPFDTINALNAHRWRCKAKQATEPVAQRPLNGVTHHS